MKDNKLLSRINKIIAVGLLGLMVCIITGGIIKCTTEHFKITTPVEEHQHIDSLKTENAKLVIEVQSLDSIKNVKTIEVKALNNDSTLKLFYELIRK